MHLHLNLTEEQVAPISEYMPSPEALVGGNEDSGEGGRAGYLQDQSSREICESKGCIQAGKPDIEVLKLVITLISIN